MSAAAADELELARSFDVALAAILAIPRLLENLEADDELAADSQRALLGLAWSAIAVEESDGGLGLPVRTRARLSAVAGRRLLPVAMRGEAFVLAPALAALAGQGDDDAGVQLERLLVGDLRGAVAVAPERSLGSKPAAEALYAHVPPAAELVACVGGDWAIVADIDRVELEPMHGLDGGQGLARVVVPAGGLAGRRVPAETVAGLRRNWLLALVSECYGAGLRVLELSVDYARQREQFGQKIASFQAVSHTLARMAVELEAADAGIGALCAGWDAPALPGEAIELALAHAIPAAARLACESAIQVHGGVGFSWELGLHLYYRRVLSIQYLLGGDAATAQAAGAAYLRDRWQVAHG
jgi:alkylation response protein AidB-like acyl-CoA dehydrogenase